MVIPARQKRKRNIDCRLHSAPVKHNSIRESQGARHFAQGLAVSPARP